MFLFNRENRDVPSFSFLYITQKVTTLELSVGISANINLYIAVILSLKTSLYDLQKRRYRSRVIAITREKWAWPKMV